MEAETLRLLVSGLTQTARACEALNLDLAGRAIQLSALPRDSIEKLVKDMRVAALGKAVLLFEAPVSKYFEGTNKTIPHAHSRVIHAPTIGSLVLEKSAANHDDRILDQDYTLFIPYDSIRQQDLADMGILRNDTAEQFLYHPSLSICTTEINNIDPIDDFIAAEKALQTFQIIQEKTGLDGDPYQLLI